MELVSTPTLECSACGDQIEDTGYLPATERDDGYEPLADGAVCEACGFSEIGLMGCAPELDDVVDSGPDDILLYVRTTDDGIDVVSTKG
ncbi:hypothetical protein [Natrinema salinisoli]|uniref:hypothetical protein n=1 Tax=Natrinema salinisoli TaxID=2878535 RepID=UPI001CF05FE4|nr:hypothetical protein [Natrinema salinisoli]